MRLRIRFLLTLLLLFAAPAAARGQTFDHSPWDRLLRAHVRDGRVDYDAFARSDDFQRYLRTLDAFDPGTLPRAERLAFWLDAYNAYTIQLINRHSERESIRNINKTLGVIKGYGPWSEPLVRVGGRRYTLDQVEQKNLRVNYDEPRITSRWYAPPGGARRCAARRTPAPGWTRS